MDGQELKENNSSDIFIEDDIQKVEQNSSAQTKRKHSEQLFIGYGEENYITCQGNSKSRTASIRTENDFYETVLDAFCTNENDTFSTENFLDVLMLNFSNLDLHDVCRQLLTLIEKRQTLSPSKEMPTNSEKATTSLMRLKKFVCSALNYETEKPNMEMIHKLSSSAGCQESAVDRKGSLQYSSSLGILNISEMPDLCCESFEGIGGETNIRDVTELSNEIEELNFQNKKLIEENTRYKSQISATDELHQQLVQDKDKLQSKIKNLLTSVEKMKELQCNNEELKYTLLAFENSQTLLKLKIEDFEKRNDELENNLKDLEEQLHISYAEIDANKQQELSLILTLCEQKHSMEQLNIKHIEIESQLTEKVYKCHELEHVIKELAEVNESLRYDKSVMESELVKTKDEIARIQETTRDLAIIEGDAPECDEELFDRHPVQIPLSDVKPSVNFSEAQSSTPIAYGTLFQGPSIVAEMDDALSPNSELPTPFCGRFRNGSFTRNVSESSELSYTTPPKKCRRIVAPEDELRKSAQSSFRSTSDNDTAKGRSYCQKLIFAYHKKHQRSKTDTSLLSRSNDSNIDTQTFNEFKSHESVKFVSDKCQGSIAPEVQLRTSPESFFTSSPDNDAIKGERFCQKLILAYNQKHQKSKADNLPFNDYRDDNIALKTCNELKSQDSIRFLSDKVANEDSNLWSHQQHEMKYFLKAIKDELKAQRISAEKANNDVKEALKIELDIPSLEQHFGDGEALVKCASDSQPIVPENIWSQNEISAAENKLISDLSNSDIREQINAEIKALRSQLVRSHALLSYLQTKEKPLSKVSSSDAQPCHQKSLDDQHMKDSFFEQSFDGQVPSRYYRSHRGSSSNTSHRSTPLHRSSRAQSCPILSIESSAVSKSTQTDPQREKGITWKNIGDHEDKATSKLPQAFKNGSVCELTKETRFAQYPYTSEIMHEGIKDFECGICEVHRSSEDPASPQFPRHRTNSFLAAVKIGNPNLVDASMDNDSGDNMHNQHHPLSKNIELEEIRHPYFGSSSTILKGFVPISKEMADVMESNKIASNPMDHQRFSENLQMPEVWKNANPDKDKGQNEGNLMSESDDGKSKNERDKSFKTSQRSMRRGSGAGSPNSLTCIPRCPAFDFSEQEEDHSLLTSTSEPEANQDIKPEILQGIQSTIAAGDGDSLQKSPTLRLKDTSQKKREASKSKTLMPELMENSETESAKGSFEYEVPEMPTTTAAEVPPPLPVPDTPFPNLPNSLLLKLGVNKESSVHVESFDEQELESKFMTLALAFKTDKMTLSKRLEIQKRQRDIAEKDIENEMKTLKDSLNSLSLNATSTETRDLIGKVLNHVDIVQQATSRISARSETFGAVQQEERVNRAFEVLMLHVENLKRLFDKEHKELEETRRMLTDTRSPRKEFGHGEGTLEERKKSLKTFGIAVGTIKSVFSLSALLSIFRLSLKVGRRRASVADFNQHSLADGQRTPSLSRSWTSGFKVDSKSRLISALCPFTSTSSVDLNSSSSSTSLPTAITPSHSGLYPPDTNSRRCSLPASPLRNTPVKNSFRVSETMIGESSRLCGLQPKNINSRKISTTRTLYSVTDEKEQSDGENETEMMTITKPTETIPLSIDEHEHSNCEMHLTEIHNEEIKRNSEKERCDSSDTEYENSDDESKQPCQSLRLAEKYFPSSMLCVWKNTSTLTLCRYSISFFLALMAFVILLMTIVPSDFSSADGSCVHDIAEVLAGKLFHVQRGYKTI